MTESEWVACTGPEPMLTFLRPTASERKLRLFAVACCRRVWNRLSDERSKAALEVIERYADGLASDDDLQQANDSAGEALADILDYPSEQRQYYLQRFAADAVFQACNRDLRGEWLLGAAARVIHAVALAAFGDQRIVQRREEIAEVACLLDIFGNPFHPVTVDPSWLRWNDGTIPRIAAGIYEERAFDRLPVLADALLDAGCDDEAILAHCHGEGPHVRGCWVIDLLLGKE